MTIDPAILPYYAAEQAIADRVADRVAPWRASDLEAQRANTDAWHGELQRRNALRLAAITALRAADLPRSAEELGADPRRILPILASVEALVAAGARGLDAAVEALRAHPRNETTDGAHSADRGACDPEEGPCDGCAGAYSEPDGPESIEGVGG